MTERSTPPRRGAVLLILLALILGLVNGGQHGQISQWLSGLFGDDSEQAGEE